MSKLSPTPLQPQQPPPPNLKFVKGFNTLYQQHRKKLQETARGEIDRIRCSLERQQLKRKVQEDREEGDLKRRDQIMRGLEARLTRTERSRSQNIRVRREVVNQHLGHVKEVREKNRETAKVRSKEIKQIREKANNQIEKRLKDKDSEMKRTFMSVQHAKNLYTQAISRKNSLYYTNMAFADRSKDVITQKMLQAEQNYKNRIKSRLQSLSSSHNRQNANYHSAEHLLDSKRKQDIHELMFSLKRSELILKKNQKEYEEKLKVKHYNIGQKQLKINDNRNALKKAMNERNKTYEQRDINKSDKSMQQILKTELRDKYESPKMRSSMKASNVYGSLSKNQSDIQLNTSKKLDEIMDRQNNLSLMLKSKAEILNRASSLKRHALFNKERINPEQVTSLH